ncbi:MAG TPA: hypothetical protein VJH68_03215 [Candidatus Nanoarchaeia archaeon]|nr:hypothetical protein [Candidatus Nanoarchaeia archaeon]
MVKHVSNGDNLKESFAKFNSLKELEQDLFNNLRFTRDKIRQTITKTKFMRQERDDLTSEVKELKQQRNQFNTVVKEKGRSSQDIRDKSRKLPSEEYVSSKSIKTMIDGLERKIETEVMPFPKELELRKKIKGLKEKHRQLMEQYKLIKEVRAASAEFKESQSQAKEVHQAMHVKAQFSQAKHEELKKLYDELRALRKTEKEQSVEHCKLKTELDQLREHIDQIKKKEQLDRDEGKELEHNQYREKVRQKTEEVKEKLRARKKLSTEDILAFQAGD